MLEINQSYYDNYISTAKEIYQNLVVRDEADHILNLKNSKHKELGQTLVSSII